MLSAVHFGNIYRPLPDAPVSAQRYARHLKVNLGIAEAETVEVPLGNGQTRWYVLDNTETCDLQRFRQLGANQDTFDEIQLHAESVEIDRLSEMEKLRIGIG